MKNIGLENFSTPCMHMKVFSSYKYSKVELKNFLLSPNGKLSCSCIIPSESIYNSQYSKLRQIRVVYSEYPIRFSLYHQLPSYLVSCCQTAFFHLSNRKSSPAMLDYQLLESIMLQNLLNMLFGISPIFCLSCSFYAF